MNKKREASGWPSGKGPKKRHKKRKKLSKHLSIFQSRNNISYMYQEGIF